ncbi:MAG: two-component system response regulator CreB [Chromatiales bacterium]|jgi:two-component system catabolic regulation response regulator CreB
MNRILVVEDEPAIADTIVYALNTEGFVTEWVANGNAALQAVEQQPPALVILDVGLPDISGFDVCREIRQQSDLPIVFLTSRSDDIDQVVGLEIGGDDYIVKPFSPRVLAARVRTRLRHHQQHQNEPANQPDALFEVEAQSYAIFLRGHNLQLSRYEFRILQLLMSHPGRVYSRAQLMELLWEEPERSYDRTVDTHVKTIRQKIRSIEAELDPIRTHRGLGYSFQETPDAS